MRRIVVVGDVMVDERVTVAVTGTTQEDDSVLRARVEAVERNLGGAGNVAANVVTLGGRLAACVSAVGGESGAQASRLAADCGVRQLPFPTSATGRTPVKRRYVSTAGRYLFRADTEDAACGMPDEYWAAAPATGIGPVADLEDAYWSRADDAPLLVLVDYDKGVMTTAAVRRIMGNVHRTYESFAPPVLVDPGRSGAWDRYAGPTTVFKANLRQCRQHYLANRHLADLVEVPEADGDMTDKHYRGVADRTLINLRACGTRFNALVVTCGAGGAAFGFGEGNAAVGHVPAVTVPPHAADVCGAGDTFLAALAVRLAGPASAAASPAVSPENLQLAVIRANAAAAVAVGRPGVTRVHAREVY